MRECLIVIVLGRISTESRQRLENRGKRGGSACLGGEIRRKMGELIGSRLQKLEQIQRNLLLLYLTWVVWLCF